VKEFEGKEMIFRPTGNNARRFKYSPIAVNIIKVSRVFVTFMEIGTTTEHKYRYKDRILKNEHEAGYVAYANKLEFDEYRERVQLSELIINNYSNKGDYEAVDLGALREIAKLLDV